MQNQQPPRRRRPMTPEERAMAAERRRQKEILRRRAMRRYYAFLALLGALALAALVGLFFLIKAAAGWARGGQASSVSAAQSVSASAPPASSGEPAADPNAPADPALWSLILTNTTNPLPEGYAPELASVGSNSRNGEQFMDARVKEPLEQMFAAAKADGIELVARSAYRSTQEQTTLFNSMKQDYINQGMSEEEAFAARRRLIYEELLILQLGIGRMKNRGAARTGAPMQKMSPEPFWALLPFSPTGAQRRAVEEILTDMAGETSMNRLLQGDVGSGKTLVAAAAIWACIRAGYQAALLAPTEILATQHAEGLNRMLAPFGMRVALLTGGMKAAARRTTLAAIRNDEADLVVGTHAILSEGVEFARLGLAVIDEQHRFGVRQRGMLAEKAANPHLLVMSATPIPRTLGLLIYGDLDISILDELPPGRTPVKTRCITGKKRRDLYHFLDQEIGCGRQVYLVCPAIEDTPDGGLNAVKSYYEDIAKALLPERRVGLMHGKLKPKEKAAVMEDFKAGRLDALVSTTVIEVGVDVPNASVMVIENAERYGLSALHQLRGRVGRGAAESWCFLVSDNQSENVQKRLKFLCSTTDGFAVAQYDLETRGPGDFFGSRQHGLPTLQIADLMNDTRTLHAAQAEAVAMLADDPLLEAPEHALLEQQVQQMFEKAGAMN